MTLVSAFCAVYDAGGCAGATRIDVYLDVQRFTFTVRDNGMWNDTGELLGVLKRYLACRLWDER
jgi:hypothetical protein